MLQTCFVNYLTSPDFLDTSFSYNKKNDLGDLGKLDRCDEWI